MSGWCGTLQAPEQRGPLRPSLQFTRMHWHARSTHYRCQIRSASLLPAHLFRLTGSRQPTLPLVCVLQGDATRSRVQALEHRAEELVTQY